MVAYFLLHLVIFGLLFCGYDSFKRPFFVFKSTTTNKGRSTTFLSQSSTHRQPTRVMGTSFVHDEMRPYAIKYHSRDQTSKGQQPAQVPFTQWKPTNVDYLRYLVDSLAVFDTLEATVASHADLCAIRVPGLERASALRADIQWMCQYDPTLTLPATGAPGLTYATYIKQLLKANDVPGLACHYYNTYFALSAGGLRIGQHLSNKLLGGNKLQFYSFDPPGDISVGDNVVNNANKHAAERSSASMPAPDAAPSTHSNQDHTSTATHPMHMQSQAMNNNPHDAPTGGAPVENHHLTNLKDTFRDKIDALAARWSPEQRQHCCSETEKCFEFNRALLGYLHGTSV